MSDNKVNKYDQKHKTLALALLLKLDSKGLIDRISSREQDYLKIFFMKRTRDHFGEIFYSRYWKLEIKELQEFDLETIIIINNFYQIVDEIRWYLSTTEDLPGVVEDKLFHLLKKLNKSHDDLSLYLKAQLS